MPMVGHADVESSQEIAHQTSATLMHQMEMPLHFMDHKEKVEEVWQLLQVADMKVVALVGMGGIGRENFFLPILWHPQFSHCLSLTVYGLYMFEHFSVFIVVSINACQPSIVTTAHHHTTGPFCTKL